MNLVLFHWNAALSFWIYPFLWSQKATGFLYGFHGDLASFILLIFFSLGALTNFLPFYACDFYLNPC